MKLSVKGLLIDYGGTIDTNGVHWGEVIREAYINHQMLIPREEFNNAYVQVERKLGSEPIILPDFTFKEVLDLKIKLQFEVLGLQDSRKAKEIALSCYETAAFHIHHASKILTVLKDNYPMLLVSNFYGNLKTILHEFNLTGFFQMVIESAEVGLRKPDPALYQLGIDKLGLIPEEVLIVGDSYKNDIQPANILGCPSVWIKGKGWNDKDEDIEHPFIIKDFKEILELLLIE